MVGMKWADTRLCDLLGIDHPIVQAPMAGADTLDMALSVSGGGGLGSLGCGPLRPKALRALLCSAGARTDRPINFNFFCHNRQTNDLVKYQKWMKRLARHYHTLGLTVPVEPPGVGIAPFDTEICEIVLSFGPQVISFHFGLPDQTLVSRIKSAGVKILCSATTVDEALWLEARGCDAVIAQGSDAGGHRGMFLSDDINTQIGTMSLVPKIVDAVDVPVIAAGGIADARGIVAALALGASGVQMGTAFLRCEEAGISDVYRGCLVSGGKTVLTNIYSGRPTRVLANKLTKGLGSLVPGAPAFPFGFCASSPLRLAAEKSGSGDFSPHYCGQAIAPGKTGTARALLQKLVDRTQAQLGSDAQAGA